MIPHTTNTQPCADDCIVVVRLAGDPATYPGRAAEFAWGPGAGPDGEGRIAAYAIVQPRDLAAAPSANA
ncbi:MAG: hypothetical protein KF863_10375 [Rubrivivax sp.]|nr:hypothetical protein [Rubrivivax sp.]